MQTEDIVVAYMSPFVPAEWIAAHGCAPCRVTPRAARQTQFNGQGVCYFCQSLAETLCQRDDAAAIVMTTTCDQMRRTAERLSNAISRPLFLMNVPATWKTETARALYRDELRRLGDFLVALGGSRPTAGELRSFGPVADARPDAARMTCVSEDSEAGGIPLLLIGSPPLREHDALLDCIRHGGGVIVADGREGVDRTHPLSIDRLLAEQDLIEALVDAYFDHLPCVFRRPNDALYEWLDLAIKTRGVRGAIIGHFVFCDAWRAEAFRIRERLDMPTLAIDYDETPDISERTRGRILAFLETLR